ncbi:hypothetical protein RB601_008229 [Gaeumannomyces tritici]
MCHLGHPPVLFFSSTYNDTNKTKVCIVDAHYKIMIPQHVSSRLLFIRHCEAEKSWVPFSRNHTLGVPDCTMPQFRPPDGCPPQRPAWDEYPVWYLFYGTLATPDVLARVLHLELGDGGIVGG